MKQKLFTLFLALVASVSAIYAQSGTCGNNLTWNLNAETGVLTISGTGTMNDFDPRQIPWGNYTSIIKTVIINDGVTSIGELAFYECSSLTSVTIGESVTSIGELAFYECSSLSSITIPESVTSIGESAFGSCESLTSITIPESVTSIGSSAFEYCSSLSSITIPNSVTSIGDYAFFRCSSLTSITIPNSVTSIGGGAFYECSSLTSITIPNSVTSIGESAFYGCSSLTSITIPESVTSIGWGAFYGCSSLTSVTIPNSVTSIGGRAFYDCSSLTSPVYNAHCFAYMPTSYSGAYTIPEGIEQIAGGAFDGCSSLTSITIPESVTSIGSFAFCYCSSLTSITIPNSVTSIGESAFRGCSSLTSVTCEAETPPTVGQYAFDGVSTSIPVYVPCECVEAYKAASAWSDFTNIQVPLLEYSIEVYVNDTIMGTAKVNYNTFCEGNQISATPNIGYHFVQWSDGNTDAIRTLELTQDTILIAEFAQSFSGQCGDSLYWELVDTTLHITGKGEMYNYKSDSAQWKLLVSSIKVLTIAEDVTKIGYDAFDACTALVTIVWNAKHAADAYNDGQSNYPIFYGIRSQIKSFTFGEAVEYIPSYLCSGMENLTSVTIPESVTSIGYAAFYNCTSLTSVTIPNSVTSIGDYAFNSCTSLTSVTIPNSVTSIGDAAFSSCNNITSVTWNAKNCNTYNFGSQVISFEFGNEVEVVPSSLCKGMEKLTSVTIPNSVKTIGTSAFDGCARLGKISLGTGLEDIAANAFAGCTRLYDIYTYATYPPFAEESSFANYNVYVYVPCDSKRDYTLDPVWGKFKFIECIESEDATTDGDVTVVPGTNDVTITWPAEDNADTYTIVIEKDGEVFCTLTFNAEGQLLNIAFAPSRDGNNSPAQYAEQAGKGYRFTVTSLESGTKYGYNIDVKDASNKTIKSHSGEFTTQSTTAVDNVTTNNANIQKIMRDGQLIIIRNGVEYNAMGQEM